MSDRNHVSFHFFQMQTGDTLYLSQSNWVLVPGISEVNHPSTPKPNILSITIDQEPITGGTNVIFTIVVDDPYYTNVNWININFNGPSGNIYFEGNNVSFTETDPGWWEYSRTDFVANIEPSGDYYYTNIFVKNDSNVESDVWPNEVKTALTN